MVHDEKGWQLEPIHFTSDMPLVGGLRRLWHSIAGKWALQYVIDQQNGFNLVVGRQLLALEAEQDELRHENARLAGQIRALQRQLDALKSTN